MRRLLRLRAGRRVARRQLSLEGGLFHFEWRMFAPGLVALASLLGACARSPGSTKPGLAVRAKVIVPALSAAHQASLELARLLPNDLARCVASAPLDVPPPIRGLMALVSQTDALPWALELPVVAYVRGEISTADERSVRVDYLRFGVEDAAAIRAAVSKAEDRVLAWGTEAPACAGELTCVSVGAEFIDARTVRLATGKLPEELELDVGNNRCVALLEELSSAVEVSARQGAGLFDSRELVGSEAALSVGARVIERMSRRHFLSPALAARVARKLSTGAEDMAMFAGLPVRSDYAVEGPILIQRSQQSLEELFLNLDDQQRLQRALGAERVAEASAIDPAESLERVPPERVLAHVDQALLKLPQDTSAREVELKRLERLLARASSGSPADESLARRQFELRCTYLNDGRSALALADARLRAGGEAPYWQAARRKALARFDVERLGRELQRAFGLAASDAGRASLELARRVRQAEDYERAEWALVTAHSLFSRARGKKLVRVLETERGVGDEPELRLALEEVPRLFAYWARLGRVAEGHDVGVHLVAFGTRAQGKSLRESELWAADAEVQGRGASVFAATSWEDDALRAQGQLLNERFADGEFELIVGIDLLDVPRRHTVVVLLGRVAQGKLVVHEVSQNVSTVHWPGVARSLIEPLHGMRGAVFPPDELRVLSDSSAELERTRRVAEATGDLVCSQVELQLTCRGPVGDARAASRGLLRTARASLGRDANALWLGGE